MNNRVNLQESSEFEGCVESKIFFANSFGIWICGGTGFAGDGKETFQLWILRGTIDDHDIVFNNEVCDECLEHQTLEDVERIIETVENWKGS